MTENSAESAAAVPPKKKPGRPSRADIEAEMRERVEAEMRAKVEAEVRAEYEQREREEQAVREASGQAGPISGDQISGDPAAEGAVTIHFVEDGLTILGKVWFRGEELTLVPGTENWDQAHVNLYKGSAETKLFALMDEDEQVRKWGQRFFRPGRWRGKRLDEIDDAELTEAEKAQLAKQQQLMDARYGAVL